MTEPLDRTNHEALLGAAPDAIIVVDTTGAIVLVNARAERLFGYGRDELIDQPIETLVPEVARGVHRERRARDHTDPRPRPMGVARELAGRRKDGSEFPAEISLSAIETEDGVLVSAVIRDGTPIDVAWTVSPIVDKSGIVIGVSSTDRVITEHKRATEERRALEERLNLSQRLESLGQLAGGIAHDFNNLLAVILNCVSFVEDELQDNEVARADVEQIRIAAERAAGLTRQLLIFGRQETIQPVTLDLNAVVIDVQTLLAPTIGPHIEIVVDAAPDLPAVRADQGQLEQVLVNLAVNARDAMPLGGTVTIETGVLEFDKDDARTLRGLRLGRYLTLSVSDTGMGMSPEVLARAFEPFFTTKASGEGTGLGLATVYGIVTEAGGTVLLYSEGELGTTVRVYLPAADEAATAPRSSRGATVRRGQGETILVVEDEQAMREVAARILRRNGYRVLEAADGDEALAVAGDQRCYLLLTDLIMPRMSGRELVERAHERWPGLPVLYMSGYSRGVLGAQRALDSSIALIQKPFGEQALVEKVRAVLTADAPQPG